MVATIAMGVRPAARSAAIAASSASVRIAYASSVGILRNELRPRPSVMQAFSMLLCASSDA